VSNRILTLPHIGTAFGHLVRIGEYIQTFYNNRTDEVFVVVPKEAEVHARRHLPLFAKIILQDSCFSVNNPTGKIDCEAFKKVLDENFQICASLSPDLIIGSPGIYAGLIGAKCRIPWRGLMHGCYLPLSPLFEQEKNVEGSIGLFAANVWQVARKGIDSIVKLFSDGAFSTWSELQASGDILIPNSEESEPSELGLNIGNLHSRIGWNSAKPVSLLITTCSDGNTKIPVDFLKEAVKAYGDVVISGSLLQESIPRVHCIYNSTDYRSLVGPQTTVICHGGHGTIQNIRGAGRVILIPGDIDQLYNSLVAHKVFSYEIALSDSWHKRLFSQNPYRRFIDWSALYIDKTFKISKSDFAINFKTFAPTSKVLCR